MKPVMSEIQNTLDKINNRLVIAEETISKFKTQPKNLYEIKHRNNHFKK